MVTDTKKGIKHDGKSRPLVMKPIKMVGMKYILIKY